MQKSRRILTLNLLVILFLLVTPLAQAAQETTTKVIAVVNGKPLTLLDFKAYINSRLGHDEQAQKISQAQRQQIFNDFINRELIYQQAVTDGRDKHPVIIADIDNQRRNIVTSFSLAQLIRSMPSEDEMKQVYEQEMSHPTTEYKTRHILVKTEKDARDIIAKLKKGADFIQMAKQHSIDASAQKGGEINWLPAQQMLPALAQAVVKMKNGSITAEPIQTRFGWHIMRLDGKRQTPPPTFEEVKNRIVATIRKRRISAYIAELHKKAKIELK